MPTSSLPAPGLEGEGRGTALGRWATRFAPWAVIPVYLLCIDLKGIWTDEGFRFALYSGGQTWQQFNRSGSFGPLSGVLNAVGPSSYQPFFYLLTNAVVRLTGSLSEVVLRLVNVGWLLLAVLGLIRLFRTHSPWTQLFGVAVLTLNGYLLMHVMQIREYPMYVALAVWASCLYFEVLEVPGPPPLRVWWPKLLAYAIVVSLLFYCHVYSVFLLAAQVALLLSRRENRAAFLRGIALAWGMAALLVLPWLVTIYLRFPRKVDPGIWDYRPSTFALLVASMREGFHDLLIYGSWSGHPLLQAFVILVIVGIPASWIVARKRGKALDRRVAYSLVTMVLYAAFQISYFFLREPLSIWPRYFVAHYLGYVLLATSAFSVLERAAAEGRKPWRGALAAAVLLLVVTAGAQQIRLYRANPYMDTGMSAQCNWRVVNRALAQVARPDEPICYYHPLLAWTMGLDLALFPNELTFADFLGDSPPRVPAFWLLDTPLVPGWRRDYLEQTLARLEALHLRPARTVDAGCQTRLIRYEPMADSADRTLVPASRP
jgi:hypothetical protein